MPERDILEAIAQALGFPHGDRQAGDPDRLAAIEAKLDSLLSASKSDTPASYVTEHVPVDIVTKTQGPDGRLVAIVLDYRPKGWAAVADVLNEQGLLSPMGKAWTNRSIEVYCRRHRILAS